MFRSDRVEDSLPRNRESDPPRNIIRIAGTHAITALAPCASGLALCASPFGSRLARNVQCSNRPYMPAFLEPRPAGSNCSAGVLLRGIWLKLTLSDAGLLGASRPSVFDRPENACQFGDDRPLSRERILDANQSNPR